VLLGGGVTKNLEPKCVGYVLKADIRHYFDTVDHEILLNIISVKIKDPNVIWLIKLILDNHKAEVKGKGMPLGNLTSQFFANLYLNELDQFVKHKMKVKYYIRYVDDFVIFHADKNTLESWKNDIDQFLICNLKVELHPEKSRIIALNKGITFLGFRVLQIIDLSKRAMQEGFGNALAYLKIDIMKVKCQEPKLQTDSKVGLRMPNLPIHIN